MDSQFDTRNDDDVASGQLTQEMMMMWRAAN